MQALIPITAIIVIYFVFTYLYKQSRKKAIFEDVCIDHGEHEWGKWIDISKNKQKRKCKVCGKTEIRFI